MKTSSPALHSLFEGLSTREINQVRMYGCTEAQLREAVEESLTYRFSGAAMYVASMLSDAQEMVGYGPYDGDTLANILEDQRHLLNRAKWILSTFVMQAREEIYE
jgi:hypothetical protein